MWISFKKWYGPSAAGREVARRPKARRMAAWANWELGFISKSRMGLWWKPFKRIRNYSGVAPDREPSRLAAATKAEQRSSLSRFPATSNALRAGTARGPPE